MAEGIVLPVCLLLLVGLLLAGAMGTAEVTMHKRRKEQRQ